MARISTYTSDTSITGVEKLLGTDEGTTKLFAITDLQEFFTQTVTLSSTLASNLLPDADDTRDLGSSSAEWRNLFIDGTASIDTAAIDLAQITTLHAPDGAGGFHAAQLHDFFADVHAETDSLYIGHGGSGVDSNAQYNLGVAIGALDAIQTGDNNTALGYNALTALTTGSNNVAVGYQALDTLTAGNENTAVGSKALTLLESSATENVAVGYNSGASMTTGTGNTLVGWTSGFSLTTGGSNVAVGDNALAMEDAHGHNTAVGYLALNNLNAGANGFNVAVGYGAGDTSTTGVKNVFVGYQAGDAITTGSSNIAIGYQALDAEDTASNNVAIGEAALGNSDGGNKNVAIGNNAGSAITDGADHVAIGHNAAVGTTGERNVSIGSAAGAGLTTGDDNICIGSTTGDALQAAEDNIFIGSFVATDTGGNNPSANVSIGVNSARLLTSGANNVFLGHDSGRSNSTGSSNVAVGYKSSRSGTTGVENVSLGYEALFTNQQGDQSIGIGYQALYTQNPSGNVDMHNVAIGHSAAKLITTGINNIAIGNFALDAEDTGKNNVAIGHNSLTAQDGTGDTNNTALGYESGKFVSSGTNNVLIGHNTGSTFLTTGGYNTIIGSGAQSHLAASEDQIVIGAFARGLGSNQAVYGRASGAGEIVKQTFYGSVNSIKATADAPGGGIDAATIETSIAEYNSEIITTIYIDIGGGSIVSSSSAGDVIGEDGVAAAYLTRLTEAKNGIVYRVEMICLEAPTTGDPDINLSANSSGTIAEDANGEGEHVLINGGTQTLAKYGNSNSLNGQVNDYIYLTHGGTTAGTYDAGKFLIKFYGAKTSGL